MGPGTPAPPGRPAPRLRGRWDFPRLRMPMGRRQGPGRGALERSEPSHLGGGAVCGTGWGRPLPRQAARAMRLGRFAPLALRLQGRTPGELCRNLVGSSAERYLCPSHRLAGDTALVLGTRGAPSGRAFALLARLRSVPAVPAASHCSAPRAGSYLLSHFFCKAARERDVITPIFLSTCFARNCLSGESYIFLLLYLALSLNWSLFLAVLIAISLH